MTPVRKLFGLIAYLMLPDYILDPKVGGRHCLKFMLRHINKVRGAF